MLLFHHNTTSRERVHDTHRDVVVVVVLPWYLSTSGLEFVRVVGDNVMYVKKKRRECGIDACEAWKSERQQPLGLGRHTKTTPFFQAWVVPRKPHQRSRSSLLAFGDNNDTTRALSTTKT